MTKFETVCAYVGAFVIGATLGDIVYDGVKYLKKNIKNVKKVKVS